MPVRCYEKKSKKTFSIIPNGRIFFCGNVKCAKHSNMVPMILLIHCVFVASPKMSSCQDRGVLFIMPHCLTFIAHRCLTFIVVYFRQICQTRKCTSENCCRLQTIIKVIIWQKWGLKVILLYKYSGDICQFVRYFTGSLHFPNRFARYNSNNNQWRQ